MFLFFNGVRTDAACRLECKQTHDGEGGIQPDFYDADIVTVEQQ